MTSGVLDACALTALGNVYCWKGTAAPTQVPTLTGVTSLSAGGGGIQDISQSGFYCAVMTGQSWCWGNNGSGQLGNNLTTSSPVPVQVQTPPSSVMTVFAGINSSACSVATDGHVWCWGNNNVTANYLLGNGVAPTTQYNPFPAELAGFTAAVANVSVGFNSACVLMKNGGVMCWGTGSVGQLGNSSTMNSQAPAQVAGLMNGATAVSVGGSYACAIVGGGVQCWGSNAYGKASAPASVMSLGNGVTSVSVGYSSACAVVNGGVWCWGDNSYGELGDGNVTPSSVPVPVSTLQSGVSTVSVGYLFACALLTNGDVYCWGGTNGTGSTPSHVLGLPQ